MNEWAASPTPLVLSAARRDALRVSPATSPLRAPLLGKGRKSSRSAAPRARLVPVPRACAAPRYTEFGPGASLKATL